MKNSFRAGACTDRLASCRASKISQVKRCDEGGSPGSVMLLENRENFSLVQFEAHRGLQVILEVILFVSKTFKGRRELAL
jgi:hypothetical protein